MHKRNLEIKGLSKEGRLLFPYIRRQTLKSEESIERGMGYGRIYEIPTEDEENGAENLCHGADKNS